MFNNKSIQRLALFLQPCLVGYAAWTLIMHIRESSITYLLSTLPDLSLARSIFILASAILNILVGYAAFRIYKGTISKAGMKAMMWNQLHLLLSFIWKILHFGLAFRKASYVSLGLLISSVIITMRYYRRVNKVSFYLLIPYLAGLLSIAYTIASSVPL